MDVAANVRVRSLAPQDPVPAGMKRSALTARVAELKRAKQAPERVLRDIKDFILPWRGRFNDENQNQRGKRPDLNVLNGTAQRSFAVLSSGMMAGLTSPARPWFKLGLPDPDMAEFGPHRKWLDDVARAMRAVFAQSNFYNVLPSAYTEIGGFGTSAMLEVEDPMAVVRFIPFTIGTYAIAQDDRLVVDTFCREYKRTVRQLVGRFGTEKLSNAALLAWKQHKLEQEFSVVHLIYANPRVRPGALGPDSMPFIEEYWQRDGEKQEPLLRTGYQERALFVPRWDVAGDDLWGTGLGHHVLGDVKQLQFLERRKEDVLDKHVSPPLEASSALRGKRVSLLAGDITFTEPRQTGGAQVMPIVQTLPGAYQYAMEDIRGLESKIRAALFEDLFLMFAQDNGAGRMTAAEVAERHQEKMLVLGPVLERLNEEKFDPIIDRTFSIMERRSRPIWTGQMDGDPLLPPPPRELEGMDITVEYTSILAQAAKATNTRGIEAFGLFVGQMAAVFGPSMLDKVDTDQLVDEYADAQGIPARIIRDDDEVESLREGRAQQEQMAAMAQMAAPLKDAASAMQTLSTTQPVEDDLAGALGGAVAP